MNESLGNWYHKIAVLLPTAACSSVYKSNRVDHSLAEANYRTCKIGNEKIENGVDLALHLTHAQEWMDGRKWKRAQLWHSRQIKVCETFPERIVATNHQIWSKVRAHKSKTPATKEWNETKERRQLTIFFSFRALRSDKSHCNAIVFLFYTYVLRAKVISGEKLTCRVVSAVSVDDLLPIT